MHIDNNARRKYFFDPGKIRAKIGGKINEETYYDSLASVMPEMKELLVGKSKYQLYFVVPGVVETAELIDFEVIQFGISTDL